MQRGIWDQIQEQREVISEKGGKIQIRPVDFLKQYFSSVNFLVLIIVLLVCTVNIRGTQIKHMRKSLYYSGISFINVNCSKIKL